jgi:hypothetical protein
MTWVKIDDRFTDHPKLISVGPLGIALQVAALCYSNAYLTDGFIPYNVVKKLLCWEFSPPNDTVLLTLSVTSGMSGEDVTWELVTGWLVDAGVWEKVDGGYYIHDYPEYQPSKESVLQERAKAQKRMSNLRSSNVRPNFARTEPEVRPKFAFPVPDPVPVPIKEKEEEGAPVFSSSFSETETSEAISEWGNKSIQEAEHLYLDITQQICIPGPNTEAALEMLTNILDYYEHDSVKAAAAGKPVFSEWCNTRGKTGRNYSPTNPAWITKWLERLAPRPKVDTVDSIAQRVARDLGLNR